MNTVCTKAQEWYTHVLGNDSDEPFTNVSRICIVNALAGDAGAPFKTEEKI